MEDALTTVTLSPKFQIVIPKVIREAMKLRSGQKIQMIYYENRIELVTLQPLKQMRGFLKGMDTRIERERDRL